MNMKKMGQHSDGNSPDRDEHDFYETPRSFVAAMLDHEKFHNNVWEPAAGKLAISSVLEARGYDVLSSDLVARVDGVAQADFLTANNVTGRDIITNPPFKFMTEFAEQCEKLAFRKWALVMPLAGLNSSGRYKRIFSVMPLKAIYLAGRGQLISSARGPIQSQFTHVWTVFDREHDGPPSFYWLEDRVFKFTDKVPGV
jgi:hypothetical protein